MINMFKTLEKEYTPQQIKEIIYQFTKIQSAYKNFKRSLIYDDIIDDEALDEMLVALKTLKKLK